MEKADIKRRSYFLDTYEGFTYENAEASNDTFWNGTHSETSVNMVREYLQDYRFANVIKSNIITDAICSDIEKIAVCNIDVDMCDAVYAALNKASEKMVKHGVIIAEDYGHTPLLSGAQYAVRKFLSEHSGEYIPLYFNSGQIFLIVK